MATKPLIKGAYEQCSKTIAEGRYNASIPNSGGKYCDTISFVTGDFINGPMHTNDAFVICGNPTLGRSAADPIEVSGPPKGWFATTDNYPPVAVTNPSAPTTTSRVR